MTDSGKDATGSSRKFVKHVVKGLRRERPVVTGEIKLGYEVPKLEELAKNEKSTKGDTVRMPAAALEEMKEGVPGAAERPTPVQLSAEADEDTSPETPRSKARVKTIPGVSADATANEQWARMEGEYVADLK
ncbi:MAG: hypothetical protein FWD69_18670, partial [Polyangiaceae bacterium]|nr:hypothetical protein [Polyangiaceae bacterium]